MRVIADNLGQDVEEVQPVIDEFLLQLHRRFYEYKDADLIGQDLHYQLSHQGYYHLLGLFDCFSERYDWERGFAQEYILRLGLRSKWLPYQHQMESWKQQRFTESKDDTD